MMPHALRLTLCLAAIAAAAPAAQQEGPRPGEVLVRLETPFGTIDLAIDEKRARSAVQDNVQERARDPMNEARFRHAFLLLLVLAISAAFVAMVRVSPDDPAGGPLLGPELSRLSTAVRLVPRAGGAGGDRHAHPAAGARDGAAARAGHARRSEAGPR